MMGGPQEPAGVSLGEAPTAVRVPGIAAAGSPRASGSIAP